MKSINLDFKNKIEKYKKLKEYRLNYIIFRTFLIKKKIQKCNMLRAIFDGKLKNSFIYKDFKHILVL